jgi:protein-S-isoprenylcysteine O-methyltransferase Ste14
LTQIILGLVSFVLFLLADFAALKRTPVVKPIAWITGTGILIYSVWIIIDTVPRFAFNSLLTSFGWVLGVLSGAVLIYALFINIPLRMTYIQTGTGKELVTSGLYSVVRHPGWCPFVGMMIGLVLVFPSTAMIGAAIVWALANLALIIFQDKVIFPRMFKEYKNYQKDTPMIIPRFRLPGNIVDS